MKTLPPVEILRDFFTYNPTTGELRWRKKPHPSANVVVGQLAGSQSPKDRYKRVRLKGVVYAVHRLCYVMITGEPIKQGYNIDHLNGDKHDNRACNLRAVTPTENKLNTPRTTKTSAFRGVWKNGKRWRAEIRINRNRILLGTFDDVNEAITARLTAEREYNIFVGW